MRLTFIGAAQEVTGSCFRVETDDVRFLVDCGMFQGGREARERNLKAWPFDPRQIDFVLLTHAHIDHSGLLPRLCALGLRGPIITTRATVDLLSVMLLDSAFIHKDEWARAQRKRSRQPRADQAALLNWLKRFESAPQRNFVVHGEAHRACGFTDRIADELGWRVEAPASGTKIDL
jgi:metallo-beta-lactamase family protein